MVVEAENGPRGVSRSQTVTVGTVNVKPKDIMVVLSWDKPHADLDLPTSTARRAGIRTINNRTLTSRRTRYREASSNRTRRGISARRCLTRGTRSAEYIP